MGHIGRIFDVHVYLPWASRDGIEPELKCLLSNAVWVDSLRFLIVAFHFLSVWAAPRDALQIYFYCISCSGVTVHVGGTVVIMATWVMND
jgi:hypothetical protein